jgi:hypothetical protein
MGSNRSLLLVLLVVGCGRQMTSIYSQPSPSAAPDAIGCVRGQLKRVGFDQTSLDVADNRLTARKYNEKVNRPDVSFRRLVDRLEIEVAPGAGGDSVSVITINARTYAETVTQRGPTETQEPTSETATSAAQTILDKCRNPVDSTSVPG